MLSNLQINPLAKALKGLTWLIGAALILLAGSIASFKYVESEADAAQSQANATQIKNLKMIDNDTLSRQSLKTVISLGDLLAAPQKYHNKYVWVKGYLNLEFEGNALYWHKTDYSNHVYRNSCWVEFSDSLSKEKRVQNYSKRYVVVKGIFDATRQGHMGLFSGEIRSISSLNNLKEKVK